MTAGPAPVGAARRTSEPAVEAVEVEVAILDRSGVIVAVNDAWAGFGAANGADPNRSGVGMSYLGACAAAAGDPVADEVAGAVRCALAGDLPAPARVAIPCHGPDVPRWFDVLVSSRFDDTGACVGATVTLSHVVRPHVSAAAPQPPAAPDQGPAEPAFYPERSERLGDVFARLLLELAPIGILVTDDGGTVVTAGRAAEELFGYGPDGLVGLPVRQLLPTVDPFAVGPVSGNGTGRAGGDPVPVDGVRADGSTLPLEVLFGFVPLVRGTGAVVLVQRATDTATRAAGPPPDRVAYEVHEVDDLARRLDAVVRRIFSSGMSVTSAAAARHTDRALTTTLIGVTEDLDRAARELREVAFRFQQRGIRSPFPRAGTGGPTA